MLLLDVDADFMVGGDCADSVEKHSEGTDIPLLISGKKLGQRLQSFVGCKTKIFLVVDHQEALYYWDQYGIKNATCIHIDSHHDAWDGLKNRVGGREGVAHCGSFIQQAMADGIIGELINIPHLHDYVKYQTDEIINGFEGCFCHRKCPFIQSLYWREFLRQKKAVPKADIITISISPEWFPVKFWSQIQNLCKYLPVRQSVLRQKYRVARKKWMAIHRGEWNGFGHTVEKLDYQFPYHRRPELAFPRTMISHRKRS